MMILLFFLLVLSPPSDASVLSTTPLYFPKSTFYSDYHTMLSTFKIFLYDHQPSNDVVSATNNNLTSSSDVISMFYTSLLHSHFVTRQPEEADMFLLPLEPHPTSRSLTRLVQRVRAAHPFWDRSLGADHFYVSCRGVGPSSSRNVVELKKNAVQVACFPSPAGEFIPHKDVSLPPLVSTGPISVSVSSIPSKHHLGYWRFNPLQSGSDLLRSLRDDPDFLIESQPSDDPTTNMERLQSSKFCLFQYEVGDHHMELLPVALAHGCVPVFITDRPIQDLPLMDLIRLPEIALFVGAHVGPDRLKTLMITTMSRNGTYEKMKGLGVTAAHHLMWNGAPQPYDAFHMVMYQLWRRRHSIRYEPWTPK